MLASHCYDHSLERWAHAPACYQDDPVRGQCRCQSLSGQYAVRRLSSEARGRILEGRMPMAAIAPGGVEAAICGSAKSYTRSLPFSDCLMGRRWIGVPYLRSWHGKTAAALLQVCFVASPEQRRTPLPGTPRAAETLPRTGPHSAAPAPARHQRCQPLRQHLRPANP